jgi:glucose/arabinose dehydrogenase
MVTPVINSGPNTTWAPSGTLFYKGSVLFAGLRGHALFEYRTGEQKLVEHIKNKYGRLRDVVLGPDGFIYIMTSNKDGRDNTIQTNDDKIIRINPEKLSEL